METGASSPGQPLNVLFCALSTAGFLFPQIGIALKLRSSGHLCKFVTGNAFESELAHEGLERIPRGDSDGPSFGIAEWGFPLHIAMQVKHIEYALSGYTPDVIVTNALGLGAMIVARERKIPLCVVGLASYLYADGDLDLYLQRDPSSTKVYNLVETTKHLNKGRALFGYAALTAADDPLIGDRFLLQSVPEASDGPLPATVQQVGALLWEPAAELDIELSEAVGRARASGRPIYYLQPSRSFDTRGVWENVAKTLAGREALVVVCQSRMNDEFGEIPENFVVRPFLPQMKLLPHVDAVITTGHTTPVLGAMVSGVPLLILPDGSGTHDTAELCHRMGVAIEGDKTKVSQDPGYFGQLFQRFLEDRPSLLKAAAASRQAFARFSAFDLAAEAVEAIGGLRGVPTPRHVESLGLR